MKKIVLIPNALKDSGYSVTDRVVSVLTEFGATVYVNAGSNYKSSNVTSYDIFPGDAELIIVVGGDGSIIDAAKYAIKYDVPILGVNLGKVGYLAEVELDNLSILEGLFKDAYEINDKMILEVEFEDGVSFLTGCAVNDIVVSHDGHLGIADIKVEDSIGNVVKYRADGIILSTPQGSTAYSLSSGGPILAHDVESILMTPVSAHSFFNRSVLFNSAEVIKVTNIGESPLIVSVDGRNQGELVTNKACTVRKAKKSIKMLTFTKNSMFTSLFKKMRIIGDMD